MQRLPGGCVVFGPGEGETVRKGNCSLRTLISRQTGARDLAQYVGEYEPGCSPWIINPRAEEVLYVIAGTGTCWLSEFPYQLQPGVGVYIPPNEPYCLENQQQDRLTIVSVCCPEDHQRQVMDQPSKDRRCDRKERPPRIVHEQDRAPIPVADRYFKLLVDKDVGCQRVTQFVGFIPPSKAPFHYHTYEEAIFVLEGDGIVHVEGGETEFAPGSSIYLPPGLKHCLENPGPTPARLLGVFYPSGSPAVAYER